MPKNESAVAGRLLVTRRKWPIPPPRGGDLGEELIVMGMEFVRGSSSVANSELSGQFAAAGRKLIEEGTQRL